MSYTVQQAIHIKRIVLLARKSNFAVAAKNGLVQLQNISYMKNGKSIVEPVTDWITVDNAEKYLERNK